MITPAKFLPSFGRRHGRALTDYQQKLVDELLPRLLIGHPVGREASAQDLQRFCTLAFGKPQNDGHLKIHLEIGFGGGEHLAGRALANPDIQFIGCEPYINGVAKLLAAIDKHQITNIRLFTDDARHLIDALPERSVEQVYILFPDPWPKLRHNKRRIVSQATLAALARIQTQGAKLLLATDHEDYCAWMLEHVLATPHYEWTAQSKADWETPPPGWIETRYQQKTTLQGRKPTFIDCVRV
jgi:tRNA (guanine-N7-)-methyltransferase